MSFELIAINLLSEANLMNFILKNCQILSIQSTNGSTLDAGQGQGPCLGQDEAHGPASWRATLVKTNVFGKNE